ncbi:MAG: hypothetical protein AAB214_21995 [Fibrobacterota bacterium]
MHDTAAAEYSVDTEERHFTPASPSVDYQRRLEAHAGLSLLSDEDLETELGRRRHQQEERLIALISELQHSIHRLLDRLSEILAVPEEPALSK